MGVTIRALGRARGAEVLGVDVRSGLGAEAVAVIEQALLDHGVLLFRAQPLGAQELAELSRHFGALQPHVQRAYQHPEVPEVVQMTNRLPDGGFDEVGARRGAIEDPRHGWHSDLSYDPKPAKATLLHALEVPSTGGNTCFSNVTAAYAGLDEALKRRVDGLLCEFRLGRDMRNPKAAVAAQNLDADGKRSAAVHPVVNAHPATGRPAIYANPLLATRILDLPEAESRAILEALFEAIDRPQHRWEHVWSVGDTLMWDNRGGTMHCGRLDYPRREARRFIRTTVTGGAIRAYRRGTDEESHGSC